jgi:hypothetical protein
MHRIDVHKLARLQQFGGSRKGKLLICLGSAFQGRHYTEMSGSGKASGFGGDSRGRLGRQLQFQLLQQNLLVLFRVSVTGQDDLPAIRRGQMNIDHLDGRHLLQNRSRGQSRRQSP